MAGSWWRAATTSTGLALPSCVALWRPGHDTCGAGPSYWLIGPHFEGAKGPTATDLSPQAQELRAPSGGRRRDKHSPGKGQTPLGGRGGGKTPAGEAVARPWPANV